jgi:hypothetical protein
VIFIERVITPEGFNPTEYITDSDGELDSEKARLYLQGVGIHGFSFEGLEAHGMHPVFQHEDLDLRIYAVPNQKSTGFIHVQVEARDSSIFRRNIHGQVVEELHAPEQLTVGQYLEKLRGFIEENLLSESRKKEIIEGFPEEEHELKAHLPTEVVKSYEISEDGEISEEIESESHRPEHMNGDHVKCSCGKEWEGTKAEEKAKEHLRNWNPEQGGDSQ